MITIKFKILDSHSTQSHKDQEQKVIETGKTADYTYMVKAISGHRSMVPLTPRVV